MSPLLWLVVAFIVLSSLVSIGTIGKKREPMTPGVAVAVIVINALLVAAIVVGGHS